MKCLYAKRANFLSVGKRGSCGRPFLATSICFLPHPEDAVLAVGGRDAVKVWTLVRSHVDPEVGKVSLVDAAFGFGKIKRSMTVLLVRY